MNASNTWQNTLKDAGAHLLGPSLPKGPDMDKDEESKQSDHLDLTIPESYEKKEDSLARSPETNACGYDFMYHTENKHGLPHQLDEVETDNSKQEIIGGDTEVKDNDSAQQTDPTIGNSDAEDDAPKKISGIKGINYCINCDLALGNAYAFRNHTRQVHHSWIRFKIEDSTQIWLCTECDLAYEEEDEFNEH